MMGPVQENDTRVRVNAMKKIESRPEVRSAEASMRLLQEAGSLMSKAPKNEIAKTTSSRKKMMLQVAEVESSLSLLAPNTAVITRPRAT